MEQKNLQTKKKKTKNKVLKASPSYCFTPEITDEIT